MKALLHTAGRSWLVYLWLIASAAWLFHTVFFIAGKHEILAQMGFGQALTALFHAMVDAVEPILFWGLAVWAISLMISVIKVRTGHEGT